MSIEIPENLKVVTKIISRRCETSDPLYRHEFMQLLEVLDSLEKLFVSKYFCKLDWNVGSLRVLAVLQELSIVTATEFLLSKDDFEQAQLILNDFLEEEYGLISNLFAMSYYANGVKLTMMLDECIRRLFADLLTQPALNTLYYLEVVKRTLPIELHTKLAHKHISIALDLHGSSLKEAFKNFSEWINEGVDDIRFTKDLYEKLFSGCEHETLSYLFKLSTMENFKQWKFYLIILQTIASRCTSESAAFIRKYLKTRLQQMAASPSITSMLHFLLTARASNATTLDVHKNVDSYAKWYKQHIGDMKFVMTTEHFQTVLQLLEQSIVYEKETDYLEVHIAIAISPPVLCGKLVQAFKSKCRAHLAQLKRISKAVEPNESIVIDDSD